MRVLILSTIASATMLISMIVQAAEVFRWVDDNGNVYYSDAQPLDIDSALVDIGPPADENGAMIESAIVESTATATPAAASPEQPPLVVALAGTGLGPCARARQQLTLLHADVGVFLSDDGLWEGSGNRSTQRSWLADASRPNAIRSARDEVLRNCSNPALVADELSPRE
jgi:hypothetical protein